MTHVNFVENTRDWKNAKPIGAAICGQRFDSVFIEVSAETYLSQRFKDWLEQIVFTRLMPEGSIRIAILNHRQTDN